MPEILWLSWIRGCGITTSNTKNLIFTFFYLCFSAPIHSRIKNKNAIFAAVLQKLWLMNKTIYVLALTLFITASIKATQPGTNIHHYHYILNLPKQYDSDKDKHWPLIIYLHGRSACGNDLNKVRRYGLPFFTERGMQLDAIAVSPQCPIGKNWASENWLEPMLRELTSKYRIDTCRIYLTGMSLGGFGTWDLAIKYPDRFAAIAPLCGGGKPQNVCAIKNVPVWAFHGDKDKQVPIARSKEMVEALRKCGGNPKFTILKGFPHDIHRTYADENLYKWMLQFSLNPMEIHEKQTTASNDTMRSLPSVNKYNPPIQHKKKVAQKTTTSTVNQSKAEQTPPGKTSKDNQTDTIKGKNFMVTF
jgi:predicted esterase